MLACLDTLCADFEAAAVSERCPLEVGVLALSAGWVVFSSTNAIGVRADNDSSLSAGWT